MLYRHDPSSSSFTPLSSLSLSEEMSLTTPTPFLSSVRVGWEEASSLNPSTKWEIN